MTILYLLLNLILFCLISVVVFYLPGLWFLSFNKKRLDFAEKISFSFCLGIIFFIVVATILGFLKLRFLSFLIYPALILLAYKKLEIKKVLIPLKEFISQKELLLLVILGVLTLGFINFPSGLAYKDGVHFWSSHGHDGLWHVAVMEEIKMHFPPRNPLYVGHMLKNYHFTTDILMGEFYRLFPFFSSLDLYFRFYPFLFAFLIGVTVYAFAKRKWNHQVALWAVFFSYFCGSFGYLYLLLVGRFFLGGESVFWASQGNTILGNPPHALGIIILTVSLSAFQLWEKRKDSFWLLVLFCLSFGLATIKVSAGLVLCGSLALISIYHFLKTKNKSLFTVSFFIGLGNLTLIKLISPRAESFLVFNPLWFPRTMMVARLDNVDFELRRQHYIWVNTWRSWLRLAFIETKAYLIFIIGNSGMRIIGFWGYLKSLAKKTSLTDCLLGLVMVLSIGMITFFVQNGVTYNLIQFMQIYFHLLGVYAAFTVYKLIEKNKRIGRRLISSAIILLSIPTVVGSFFDFYARPPLSTVTNGEKEALEWLNKNSSVDSIVLTKPFDSTAGEKYEKQPWPISAWYSTPYVFVFSKRYAYLTTEEQLDITGYDIKDDLAMMDRFFTQNDSDFRRKFAKDKRISFVYTRKDETPDLLTQDKALFAKVYENDEVVIYKILD